MTTTTKSPPRRACGTCRAAAAALITCSALAASGCNPAPAADPDRRKIPDEVQYELDKQFVRDPFTDQARQAVLRARCLNETQFEPNSARLTSIGRRDLSILAEALRTDGGTIAVQRGEADAKLYAARLDEVRRRLTAAGIREDRFVLNDGAAGGTGIATAEALVVRKDMSKTPLPSETGQILDPRGGMAGSASPTGGPQ